MLWQSTPLESPSLVDQKMGKLYIIHEYDIFLTLYFTRYVRLHQFDKNYLSMPTYLPSDLTF